MKTLNFIVVYVIFMFVTSGSVCVYGQEEPEGLKPSIKKFVAPEISAREQTDRLKEELNLTDKQYKKVYKLNLKEEKAKSAEARFGNRSGMGDGMHPGMRPDGGHMRPDGEMGPKEGFVRDIADLKEKAERMQKHAENMDKKMKRILNTEQYEKWQTIIKNRRIQQKRELDIQRQRRELALPEE